MSGRVLILGAACGYSTAALRPFMDSAQQSLPDCKIVLFAGAAHNYDGDEVEVRVPPDQRLRSLLRSLPRGTRMLSSICLKAGGILQRFGLPGTTLMQSGFGVAVARYFWYLEYLKSTSVLEQKHVLLADTRDVVFQSDPFDCLPPGKLFCGEEPISMGQCAINSGWYARAYDHAAIEHISGHPVLCSGVIGGARELMIEYLEKMCSEILRVGDRILWSSGFDQAVHNHLLRNTQLGAMFICEPWTGSRLTTLHHANSSALSLNTAGDLTNATGELVSIVHQYDRHPHLRDWVEQRWSCKSTAPGTAAGRQP